MDAPEIAGQLAGQGARALIDSVVFGAMLLLVSRAWLTVAPTFGRPAARALLLYGLPAVVLGSFSGHWIVGPWWGPHAEALQLTALILDFSLLLFWIVGLATGAILKARRRGVARRDEREPRPRERIAFGAVTLAVCLGAWWIQWDWYLAETADLARKAKNVSETVTPLEIVANKLEEFVEENRLLDAKIRAAQTILPESMDVHAFMEGYETIPPSFGLKVESWSAEEAATGRLQRVDITLRLSGLVAGLPELAAKTGRMARLVQWRLVDSTAAETTVVLSIFALPREQRRTAVDPCAVAKSRVWLWPYTARLAARRGDLTAVCDTLARLRPVGEQVDAFMAERAYVDELIRTIVKLRPERSSAPSRPDDDTGGQ